MLEASTKKKMLWEALLNVSLLTKPEESGIACPKGDVYKVRDGSEVMSTTDGVPGLNAAQLSLILQDKKKMDFDGYTQAFILLREGC